MYRRPTLAVVALLTAATTTLVAGCGSGSGNSSASTSPKSELVNAVRALGKASTLTTTVRLQTSSPAALARAVKRGGDTLTPAQATALASGQAVFETVAPKGKTLSTAGKTPGASSITVGTGTTPYAQLVIVNSTLYVKADLRDALTLAGKKSVYNTLRVRVRSLPSFVKSFAAGGWVSLPEATATGLVGSVGGSTTGSPTPSTAQSQALVHQLQAVLSRDVTVTRVSHGATDQLQLTADSRVLGKDLLKSIGSAVPGVGGQLGRVNTNTLPNQTLHLTATVTQGALTSLSFDLAQLEKALGTLPLTVTFARSGPAITAPSGATPVDLSQLGTLLGAFSAQA